MLGGAENATLYVGTGADVLYIEDGYDFLVGGHGNDTLYGGVGEDVLIGGTGADDFEFTCISSDSFVTDLDADAGDVLRIINFGGDGFDSISLALTDRGFVFIYHDTLNVGSHDLTITFAETASEFTLKHPEILDVLGFV